MDSIQFIIFNNLFYFSIFFLPLLFFFPSHQPNHSLFPITQTFNLFPSSTLSSTPLFFFSPVQIHSHDSFSFLFVLISYFLCLNHQMISFFFSSLPQNKPSDKNFQFPSLFISSLLLRLHITLQPINLSKPPHFFPTCAISTISKVFPLCPFSLLFLQFPPTQCPPCLNHVIVLFSIFSPLPTLLLFSPPFKSLFSSS